VHAYKHLPPARSSQPNQAAIDFQANFLLIAVTLLMRQGEGGLSGKITGLRSKYCNKGVWSDF